MVNKRKTKVKDKTKVTKHLKKSIKSNKSYNPQNVKSQSSKSQTRKYQRRKSNIKKVNKKTQKKTQKFVYLDINNKLVKDPKIISRINKLRIPPGYHNVQIAEKPGQFLQAIGLDDKERKQYIYHPKFIQKMENEKFSDLIHFGNNIGQIRRNINNNIKNSKSIDDKNKVINLILYLADKCNFRVGNQKYCEDNKSYGLTTLNSKHFKFHNNNATIEFVGKKNVINTDTVSDNNIVKLLKQIVNKNRKIPYVFNYIDENQNIRNINSSDINNYLKQYHPNLTVKMFRTWKANHTFLQEICRRYINNGRSNKVELNQDNQIKNNIKETIEIISDKLHNTPAVSKKSYLDSNIINIYQKNPNKIYREIEKSGIKRYDDSSKIDDILIKILKKHH